jgi:hypothetical protein
MTIVNQAPIGIVVNPMSGKDVRRLVSQASVFDNREKAAIVRRAVAGAVHSGARHFAYMDDSHNIAGSALAEVEDRVTTTRIASAGTGTALETERAAIALGEMHSMVNLVLGGDGTSRAFVKGWRQATLVALSTGTNNVFPQLIEATIAGAALGLIAAGRVKPDEVTDVAKIIDIEITGEPNDVALIDAVVTSERFVGARALLEPAMLQAMLLSRADPAAVGMTSVGGLLAPLGAADAGGVYLKMGKGKHCVSAPISPGVYRNVNIESFRHVTFSERLSMVGPCVVALDGERERVIKPGQKFTMWVSDNGPKIIDVSRTLRLAAANASYLRPQTGA